ncbi:S-adenosyl-L-methionine-dependent methyltransferase [Pseudomassariella vexata]|uniref:S-adenosyl-L-methionine-dependent methyltransferase n=1 Tax=Pseudomassariella vexata TaxID=1141098 RepID=A0A1Y2D8N9_9PEZI|nr:S-adenosyl-L-methionine-dependent methyltransferase [Pseudomassariella vexata]ORY55629.1 S-adenosyl-L-methionine-dependent methyltransferase [Pseudomassariella vexata]
MARQEADIHSESVPAPGAPAASNMVELNGHLYDPSGKIFVANDASEHHRCRLQHQILKDCLNGNLMATKLPPDVAMIVDVGTGIGQWAAEVAQQYPKAQVIGMDISKVQDTPVPDNVSFEIHDVEDPWNCEPNSVDFVHIRDVTGGIHDWLALVRQAYKSLKPGGQLEMTETRAKFFDFDGTFGETGTFFVEFENIYLELASKTGMDWDPVPSSPDWLNEAGFEKIVQRSEIMPIGSWPKDAKLKKKAMDFTNMWNDGGWETKTARLFTTCGWEFSDFRSLLDRVKKETADSGVKAYATVVFTTARKPKR